MNERVSNFTDGLLLPVDVAVVEFKSALLPKTNFFNLVHILLRYITLPPTIEEESISGSSMDPGWNRGLVLSKDGMDRNEAKLACINLKI